MKTVAKALIWIIVLVAILYGGYRGFRYVQARKEAAKVAAGQQARSAPVKVAVEQVQRGDIRSVVWVTGEVRPLNSVEVVPKIAGRLQRLRRPDGELIEEGVMVKKGEIVAVIEHAQLEAAVRSAEAALEVARAAHETAKVNLSDARREKQRWENLRKQGSGTELQYDQAMTAFERAEAQVKQAESQVAQAQAALKQAQVNLEDATLESPLSGIVSRKFVDEGAFVGPSTPLFRIVDIDQVEMTGGVAGRHYPQLEVGQTKAEVQVDAYPGETFSGAVTRVRPELDPMTRTAAVTIRVPNEEHRLKPGMFARIRLVLDERKEVLRVPDEALLSSEGPPQVFVVNNGKVALRTLRLGLKEGAFNEVLEGLRPGEEVVVRGHALLREDMTVETEEVQDR